MTEDHTMSSCSLRHAVNAAREPLEAGMVSEAAMLEMELFCTHSVMARMTARMAPKRLTLLAHMTYTWRDGGFKVHHQISQEQEEDGPLCTINLLKKRSR